MLVQGYPPALKRNCGAGQTKTQMHQHRSARTQPPDLGNSLTMMNEPVFPAGRPRMVCKQTFDVAQKKGSHKYGRPNHDGFSTACGRCPLIRETSLWDVSARFERLQECLGAVPGRHAQLPVGGPVKPDLCLSNCLQGLCPG